VYHFLPKSRLHHDYDAIYTTIFVRQSKLQQKCFAAFE